MKIRIEIAGHVLEGELIDEDADLVVRREVEEDGNKRKLLDGGDFRLVARFDKSPEWRTA